MLSNDALGELLAGLKAARERIVADFFAKSEKGLEIRAQMFKFEKSPAANAVCIDAYKLAVMNYHLEAIAEADESEIFAKATDFVERQSGVRASDEGLFKELVSAKKRLLGELISVGENAELNLKKLHADAAKGDALFAREIERLSKGE